jgi:hypothetical protein
MSIKAAPIVCDVCGVEKQSVNHWWFVRVEGKTFRAGPLTAKRTPGPNENHACGSGHAATLFQRFLGTGKLDKEMHPDSGVRPVGLTEAGLLGKKEGKVENQDEVQVESEDGRQEGSPPAVD